MKRFFYLIILSLLIKSCGSYKPTSDLTLNSFLNLENLKCKKYGIEEYLINSGDFKSTGTSPTQFGSPAKNFITLNKHKRQFIIIRLFEDTKQYTFLSYKPTAYNYIRKNGEFVETVPGENSGITNLIYKMNNSKFMLEMDETVIQGKSMRSYKIVSWCYKY